MDRITLSKSINEQINSLTSSERDSLLFRYMLNERMAEVDEPYVISKFSCNIFRKNNI